MTKNKRKGTEAKWIGKEKQKKKAKKKNYRYKILIPKCPVYFYIYFSIYETL